MQIKLLVVVVILEIEHSIVWNSYTVSRLRVVSFLFFLRGSEADETPERAKITSGLS